MFSFQNFPLLIIIALVLAAWLSFFSVLIGAV